MSAINSIDSIPDPSLLSIGGETQLPETKWTQVKVKRVWLSVLSALALIAGCVCSGIATSVSLWFLAPAIPLFLASGILIWYRSKTIDYENPKELSQVRSLALQMSLSQIVEKHGWENLFRHAILSPSRFQEAYSAHVHGMKLLEICSYYEETRRQLDRSIQNSAAQTVYSFYVPSPELWKSKLHTETNDLNFRQLLANYPLDRLIRYNLISPEELQDSYRTFANHAPLCEIVQHYEKGSAQIRTACHEEYELPSPEYWKKKFPEETARMSCREILASYAPSPDQLLQFKIISQKEYELLDKGRNVLRLFNQREEECNAEFVRRTEKERAICEQSKNLAKKSYDSNPSHRLLVQLDSQYFDDLRRLEIDHQILESSEKAQLKNYETLVLKRREPPVSEEERIAFTEIRTRCEMNCALFRERLKAEKNTLYNNNWYARKGMEESISAAQKIREEAIVLADLQFSLAVKPIREEMDAKLARYRDELNGCFLEINAQYDSFRSATRS